jgi:hypothetical protein
MRMGDAKVVFGSNEWVEAAQRGLDELLAANAARVAGQSITVCEVFTNVPPDLTGGRADGTRAWHFTVKDGRAFARDGELKAEETDMKIVTDYNAILPLARKVYVTEQGDAELVAAYREELARDGRYRSFGDRSRYPAELGSVLSELHNRLARITA